MPLEFIQLETGNDPQFAIIWLHGLGANGHDFEPIVPELGLTGGTAVRFIFPHAPKQPVTVNGGMVMPAWYDIYSLEINQKIDETGIEQSADSVLNLIEAQINAGIPSERIILAGFSQGGVIALHTGLLHHQKLLGIIALSTYVAIPKAITESRDNPNRDIPIFMGHGTHDPVIPVQLAHQGYEFLDALDYPIIWKTYPMEHSVNMEEIKDIGAWINQRIASDD